MELLFGISYTNKDDVIYMLVNPETGIPEQDFNVSTLDEEGNPTGQVEIIGWLYQYYNTELKDDTFAKLKKNVKITKERFQQPLSSLHRIGLCVIWWKTLLEESG